MAVKARPQIPSWSRLSRSEKTALFKRQLQLLKACAPEDPTPDLGYRFACAATFRVLEVYWVQLQSRFDDPWSLPALHNGEPLSPLASRADELAEQIGAIVAQCEPISAGYRIGEVYTALLPAGFRSRHGVFYTPPALTHRLMDLATRAGLDWAKASILDPACGGGAFLTPVALKILSALGRKNPLAILEHVSTHLRGFEIDAFGAWVSQVLLESALLQLCRQAGRRLPSLVTVCDALASQPGNRLFDLVIGNPPYGRLTLEPEVRDRYQRSLHGHANAYGLFMDLGVRWARPGGVVAYITPTGFLGGQYFKELRKLMAQEAPPVAIDLVTSRKGVFSDVLQETLLATYRKGGEALAASVHVLSLQSETRMKVEAAGSFSLPPRAVDPWLIPRDADQGELIERLRSMPHRLSDYGYKVSTGPLVWNRHKSQLHNRLIGGAVPILWAECVTTEGAFEHRTERRNHRTYVKPKQDQGWLLTTQPCVLVQRTTAKEQRRRLYAAELPAKFIRAFGAVSVENHLNMVKPVVDEPQVSLRVIAALLNSEIVDAAFRCISGSVAVSATELGALPLPSPAAARRLEKLLATESSMQAVQDYIRGFYLKARTDVAA